MPCADLVICCRYAQLVCKIRPVRYSAGSALFEVRGVEQRNLCRRVYCGVLLDQLRLRAGPEQHCANALFPYQLLELVYRIVPAHDAEELAGLCPLVHGGQAFVYPGLFLRRQVKGFSTQDHSTFLPLTSIAFSHEYFIFSRSALQGIS